MGLLDKMKSKEVQSEDSFTVQELEFLLLKMRSATYKGEEFETFYKVWIKITKEIENLKK